LVHSLFKDYHKCARSFLPPLSHSAPFRSLLARKARRTLLKPPLPKLLLTLLPLLTPLKALLLKPLPLQLTLLALLPVLLLLLALPLLTLLPPRLLKPLLLRTDFRFLEIRKGAVSSEAAPFVLALSRPLRAAGWRKRCHAFR